MWELNDKYLHLHLTSPNLLSNNYYIHLPWNKRNTLIFCVTWLFPFYCSILKRKIMTEVRFTSTYLLMQPVYQQSSFTQKQNETLVTPKLTHISTPTTQKIPQLKLLLKVVAWGVACHVVDSHAGTASMEEDEKNMRWTRRWEGKHLQIEKETDTKMNVIDSWKDLPNGIYYIP